MLVHSRTQFLPSSSAVLSEPLYVLCSSVILVQSAVLLLPKVGIGVERREAEGRAWARKVALNAQGNSTPGATRTPHQTPSASPQAAYNSSFIFKSKHNTTICLAQQIQVASFSLMPLRQSVLVEQRSPEIPLEIQSSSSPRF